MDARARLAEMRTKLADDFGGVKSWYGLYGLILFNIAGALGASALSQLTSIGRGAGNAVFFLVLLVSIALVAVVWLATNRSWRRHYELTWRWLQHTSLAALVIDEAAWGRVIEQAEGSIALKATGLEQPRTMEQMLELSADYWRTARAMAGGGDARALRRAVAWDNGTRVYNNAVSWLCNSCASMLILIGLALPLCAAFPLVYIALGFYIQQNAVKSAYVDYFLDKPRLDREKLTPPS